jgi:hypothetical protein
MPVCHSPLAYCVSVPANVRFEIDDCEEEWIYKEKFDYIHGRMMTVAFKQPKTVLQSAFDALAPGGYLEMQDACFPGISDDGSLAGTALEKWNDCVVEGARKLGRPWTGPQHYKRWMEEIGFEDVREEIYRWPVNAWCEEQELKDLSAWVQRDFMEGLQALSLAVMTRGLGWTVEEVEKFLLEVRKDAQNVNIHCYWPM